MELNGLCSVCRKKYRRHFAKDCNRALLFWHCACVGGCVCTHQRQSFWRIWKVCDVYFKFNTSQEAQRSVQEIKGLRVVQKLKETLKIDFSLDMYSSKERQNKWTKMNRGVSSYFIFWTYVFISFFPSIIFRSSASIAKTSPVNLHGHRREGSTKRKKKEGYALHRIQFGLPLLPRCHAAFYNCDLCWANVQIAFLSAIPVFEHSNLSGHNTGVTAAPICKDITSVTATCQPPLSPYAFSKPGTTAGDGRVLALRVLSCHRQCSQTANSARAKTRKPHPRNLKVKIITAASDRWGHVSVVFI